MYERILNLVHAIHNKKQNRLHAFACSRLYVNNASLLRGRGQLANFCGQRLHLRAVLRAGDILVHFGAKLRERRLAGGTTLLFRRVQCGIDGRDPIGCEARLALQLVNVRADNGVRGRPHDLRLALWVVRFEANQFGRGDFVRGKVGGWRQFDDIQTTRDFDE